MKYNNKKSMSKKVKTSTKKTKSKKSKKAKKQIDDKF